MTARGPRQLPREGARAGVRSVPDVQRVRHAAAVVGRAHHPADARHARALRPAGHGPGDVLERALHQRSRASRLCRSRHVHGRPGFLHTAHRAARPRIPARALATDQGDRQHGPCEAGQPARGRTGAQGRVRGARRARVPVDVARVDRRSRRQRGGDDDDHRGCVRQPADDEERLPPQQRAHRLLLRTHRGRQAGGEPRRGRASVRARRWRPRSCTTAPAASS